MNRTFRSVSWMAVSVLIVIGTYLIFNATHTFYKFYLLGGRYYEEGQYSRALPYLLSAYRMDPENKSIAWKLVWTYGHLNREGEGRRVLEEINNRFPADPKVSESLGDLAFSEKAYGLAQRYYGRVLARKPSVSVRRKLANVLLAQKKYADAIGQMDILLSFAPDDIDLRYQHAQVISAAGDHERAARELQALLDDGETKKEVITMLGDELRLLGRDEEAIKIYKRAENG